MAAHARDVNILIWTSRKSVDHGTNDRVMVHGEGTRADGRRSRPESKLARSWGRGTAEPPGDFWTVNQMYSDSGG